MRPILAESAFLTLWEHNRWIGDAYPNFDGRSRLGGDVPDVLLGEVLEDRRSLLRRSLNRRVRRFGGVLRALGRRRGQRRGADSDHASQPTGWAASGVRDSTEASEHLEQRWTQISDWLIEDPPVVVEEVTPATEMTEREVTAPSKGEDLGSPTEDLQLRGAAGFDEVPSEPERRRTAGTRPPRQRRAVASTETGQRGRGKRASKARKRRSSN